MEDYDNPINAIELAQPKLGQELSGCVCFNLRKAARTITHHYDEILKPSGLLVTQFTVLAAISVAKSKTINELASVLVMDRTTLTRNLKPLEREEWLRVEHGQDRRTRMISLTTKGELALAKAIPLWRSAQDNVEKLLGHERLGILLSNLSETTTLFPLLLTPPTLNRSCP